ncbi:ecto-ADP-ribosyltransferase 5-like isoform X2 [Bufo gargarizans]|uniref:ecto-ADP-ribosyltransferase 5-like isoform X2 n=1 Tax=Bufo gargarizans TaxID=30331 RepID=UPI001CF2F0FF|nr:ecto-ADP-ribosyltransferase 5-like isoform X2 [Bufo gargarizans]
MIVQYVVAGCVVLLFCSTQLCCMAKDLDMQPNAFDDQYIGCEVKMEKEMQKILGEERKYKQFDEMWIEATKHWSTRNLKLPDSFKHEYGVAVVLYTMEKPYSIYKQLNGNVSIAGQSRDHYMKNFHFKALHFYLTRALQVLREGCAKRFTTYRGTELGNINIAKELRFGRFTSSSLDKSEAENFGTNPFFIISTCFGVDIDEFSNYDELEVLIPVAETFRNIKKSGSTYTVESTGQLCSYFNCAYLGEERIENFHCSSGTFLYSGSSARLFLGGLIMNIVIAWLY